MQLMRQDKENKMRALFKSCLQKKTKSGRAGMEKQSNN